MPYINTKVSVSLSEEQELSLKKKLGEAISLLPGKSEQWLMLSFEDRCRLWFAGSSDKPAAFVEVKVFGAADSAACNRMTARVTEILSQELGIAPTEIYVKYEEVSYWGWNGANF